MADEHQTILEQTLAALTREFGEPVCRGDCCWWTLSQVGRSPVRLSVFIDGDSARAEGWICDVQDPAGSTQRFSIQDDAELPPLVARVRQLLARETHVDRKYAIVSDAGGQAEGM